MGRAVRPRSRARPLSRLGSRVVSIGFLSRTGLIALALVLLIGSAAAFARTERLKLAPSPIAKPKFERHVSPGCGCKHTTAQLSFLLRRPEQLDVSVVDSDGDHVATLAEAQELAAGRVSFKWDGRDDDGQLVPDGLYRLKVRLRHDRRTILLPKAIFVDTTPPDVRVLAEVSTAKGLVVRYRANEAVRAFLLLDGKKVARGSHKSAGSGRLEWTQAGTLPQPTTGLTVVAVDRAGNRSEPVPVVVAS